MQSTLTVAAAAMVLACTTPAYAGSYGGAMVEKGISGILNILYSPLEILVTPVRFALEMEQNQDHALSGIEWGLAPGFILAGNRATLGAMQLLTFPIVDPDRDYAFEWFLVDFRFYDGEGGYQP